MSWNPALQPGCPDAIGIDAIETLIVPRSRPRQEQLIRAVEAERLGLVSRLDDSTGERQPLVMAKALRELPDRPRPSEVTVPGLLDGLDLIRSRVAAILSEPGERRTLRQAAE